MDAVPNMDRHFSVSLMNRKTFALLTCMFAALPAFASPSPVTGPDWVHLRAGPDVGFPHVADIPPRSSVVVHGCISGYAWCDISTRGARGWAPSHGVRLWVHGRPVSLLHGRSVGIPILYFSVTAYWRAHYPGRPWYREHPYWERYDRRHLQPHPPRHGVPPFLGPSPGSPATPRPPSIPSPPPPGHGDAPSRSPRG